MAKTAEQLKASGAKRGRVARRRASESCRHELGVPERPAGKTRAFRNAWNQLCAELLAARKLFKDDGQRLLDLIQARADLYRGAGERKEQARQRLAQLEADFDSRQPEPEPVATPEVGEIPAPAITLDAFLAAVKHERNTLTARLVPGQTVLNDIGAGGQNAFENQNSNASSPSPYAWTKDDAATVARDYCQQVTQGGIVACELLKRACARHLADLENGAARGLFYDPVAARNIVQWFEVFCGLHLEGWEVWIVTSLFAWKGPAGLRRFREALISVARKNGKTALSAGIGLWGLVCDGEPFAEVYSAATKKDQARIIWKDSARYRTANPELSAHVKRYINSLTVDESLFQPLSADTRSLDGLRPHFILADELAEWNDSSQWEKLVTGTASRTQPLVVATTTAGASQQGFAYGKFDVAAKILNGVIVDDSMFAAIYALEKEDDYADEKNWPKANPNLGVSVNVEVLRKQLRECQQSPSALNSLLRYHMNQWVSFKAGRSIPAEKWNACRGYPDMPNASAQELLKEFLEVNFDQRCYGGLDLGLVNDLTSFVLLWPRVKMRSGEYLDKVVAVALVWVPEVGLLEKEKSWNVPLTSWVRQGFIKALPGDMTDTRIVAADIKEICAGGPGKVVSVGYDPWAARVMCAQLAESKCAEFIEVPQKYSSLTVPCRELKEHIFAGNLWHLGNPVMRWMFSNVVIAKNEKHGGIIPQKLSPNEKIDIVQATCTAWARMLEPSKILNWNGEVKFID